VGPNGQEAVEERPQFKKARVDMGASENIFSLENSLSFGFRIRKFIYSSADGFANFIIKFPYFLL